MELRSKGDGRKYITVLADGKFHQTVPEGTPGAVTRTYEDKNDVEQTKVELVFDEASGFISKLSFKDGDYGKSLEVEIDGDGVVSLGADSSFGEDFMKKLPSVNLSEPVKLAPYSFTADNGKLRKGMSIYQGDVKVENFYYDADNKKSVNGIPEVEGDTKGFDADDWKMHFLKVRKFLVAETLKIAAGMGDFVKTDRSKVDLKKSDLDSFDKERKQGPVATAIEYPEEEINPEDIPF